MRLTLNGAEGPNIDNLDFTFVAPIVTPPAAPTDLVANVVSSTQINLFWTDNAEQRNGIPGRASARLGRLVRPIATLGAGATSFSNTGLTASTQYVYRVRAANSAGDSDYSNEANATTLPPGSTTPSVTSVNPGPGQHRRVPRPRRRRHGLGAQRRHQSGHAHRQHGEALSNGQSRRAPSHAVLNTSGGGDIIVARPVGNLAPNTSYTFEVTGGLQDVTGVGFAPFTSTFTTGTQISPVDTSIQFEKVPLANVPTGQYTALTIGPDGKLYAAGVGGHIFRWNILADGTLGTMETITSLIDANGDNRLLIGLTFDPARRPTTRSCGSPTRSSRSRMRPTSPASSRGCRAEPGKRAGLRHQPAALGNRPRHEPDRLRPRRQAVLPAGQHQRHGRPGRRVGDSARECCSAPPCCGSIPHCGTPRSTARSTCTPKTPIRTIPSPPAHRLRSSPPACATPTTWSGIQQRPSVRADERLGRRRQHARHARPIPPGGLLPRIDAATTAPTPGPSCRRSTASARSATGCSASIEGGYYGHPNPTRNEFVLNGGNPTSGADPGPSQRIPGRHAARSQLARLRLRLRH